MKIKSYPSNLEVFLEDAVGKLLLDNNYNYL